jgi:hypothetical protein
MKYIFVAGAPGSKWSSVVKNIYYSSDIDRSDYSDARTYYHDASGKQELMHLGAYFDPGMEFDLSQQMNLESKQVLEEFFDSAFASGSKGVRIIKSHIFSNNIDFIRRTWPDCPIVLVHRDDDACLGWWVKCGHFDISYPLYHSYYRDLRTMARIIQQQNAGINAAWHSYKGTEVYTNLRLALNLGLQSPPAPYIQQYQDNDIRVKVI